MAVIRAEIRSGAYYDSAFLMQLQRSLNVLDGVIDAGVIMGTEANKELLAHIDLVSPEVEAAQPDDLVVVIRAESDAQALDALGQVDDLLTRRKVSLDDQEYRPQSIETAVDMLPDAAWVLVSVAGRYAAGVARDALRQGRHVFLFSDNVPVEEEIELKKMASQKGLLVMGPDCGTAIIGGIGLGFANKVRKGPIGMVAAAGTGLQQVSSRIHQLGSGMTFGIGTGGRDLSEKVGATTFLQGLDVLARDENTSVIVLVSKPPAASVADKVLQIARKAGKPVVVVFIGRSPVVKQDGNLYFAASLDDAAAQAVELAASGKGVKAAPSMQLERFASGQRYLRGLFSGGTLAYEAQYILQDYLPRVWANAPLKKENKLQNSFESKEHSIVDLGEDEFTQGRLHPMMDNELRIRRLMEEAKDPSVAVIMLDVVIGYGSHPDPASELAPAVAEAKALAQSAGRYLEVVAVVTGTDEDPQNFENQIEQMRKAGTWVETSNEAMVAYAGRLLKELDTASQPSQAIDIKPADLKMLQRDVAAINVGLESFYETLQAQEVPVVQLNWRPPAAGNEKLMGILERMKAMQP